MSIAVLPSLFGVEDEAMSRAVSARLRPVSLERGEILFRAGTPGDDLFIVASGRLVAVGVDGAGRRWASAVMTAGATVGEMAMLTGGRRSADVVAVRQSELFALSRADFEAVSAAHPGFMIHVSRVLAERLSRAVPAAPGRTAPRVIAVVGLDRDGATPDFVVGLAAALGRKGGCARIDAEIAARAVGGEGLSDRRLDAWLAQEEARHRCVLLEAGSERTPWLARCLERADHVLLVAEASSRPGLRPVEAGLHADGKDDARFGGPSVSLALVHREGTVLPSGTARWLAPRPSCRHHHVRRGRDADVQRLARMLAGRGVGVVLGGGGALGAAHVGVLEALVARGVPVDAIGGTSAGGGVGAQYAMGWSFPRIRRANLETFVENNPFRAVTLPVISVCSRDAMDRAARHMFGDVDVEDLWTTFFCVSTDLTHGVLRVHRRGPLWLAVRASTSLPGVAPPVIEDGAVLVDGGVLDNLPTSAMAQTCGGAMIAVDIAREVDLPVDFTYEEMPGPLGAILDRVNPLGRPSALPTLPDVLLRTITVSSRREREKSHAAAQLVLRPPLDRFGIMDFAAFDEIRAVARAYAEARLAGVDVDSLVESAGGAGE